MSKSKLLVVRCEPSELAAYRLLASRRGEPLAAIVRGGLAAACRRTCLCEPGKPECLMCQEKRSRMIPGVPRAVPKPQEPTYARDPYSCQAEPEVVQPTPVPAAQTADIPY